MMVYRSTPSRWGALICLSLCASFFVSAHPALAFDSSGLASILLEPDGAGVTVTDARVDRIAARNHPPYFVVGDWLSPGIGLVVLCRPPEGLRKGSTVDISGTMGTLPNGERCVISPVVRGIVDKDGKIASLPPAPALGLAVLKPALDLPVGPIPPVDPSDQSTGSGVAGEVTAVAPTVVRFSSVSSLYSTPLPILAPVELSCAPIREVGNGFIVVGEDASDAAVKVYTSAPAKPGDRVLSLSGALHTEDGGLVLYAGSGPPLYFDPQGFVGGVTLAMPGTTAYAASLPSVRSTKSPGIRMASADPPSTENGDWVYLTGRVVTGVGGYYTGGDPSSSTQVYYVQTLDKLPGIRVWRPYGVDEPLIGDVVDIMAEVHTSDGERILGDGSDTSTVERVQETSWGGGDNRFTNAYPVFMHNKALGSGALGNNPGVSGGQGLNNIGARVRTTGQVVGKGYCYYDWMFGSISYIQIDDGSQVPWDGDWLEARFTGYWGIPANVALNCGVVVLNPPGYDDIDVDDYVSVTGISSLWIPNEGDSYRTIRFPTEVREFYPNSPSTWETTNSGDIPVELKLYGTANESYAVRVYTNTGISWAKTIQCDGTGYGHDESILWEDVPSELDTDGDTWGDTWPAYSVSAGCEGFKTRTNSGLTPGSSTAQLYLVPLRKIYPVETTSYTLGQCVNPSVTLSTHVFNADHEGIVGQPVKFWTDVGTFASDGSRQTTTVVNAGSGGLAQATLYAGYLPGDNRWGHVAATDDLNTPPPTSNDPRACKVHDWELLKEDNGLYLIYYHGYDPTLTITPPDSPQIVIKKCDNLALTATLEQCGNQPIANQQVTFEILYEGPGNFVESGTRQYAHATDSSGVATATVHPTTAPVTIQVKISASPHGYALEQYRTITVVEHSPIVTAEPPLQTIHAAAEPLITFHATNPNGSARQGLQITVSTTAGTLEYPLGTPLTNPITTNSSGDAPVYVHLDPPASATVTGTFTDDCGGQNTAEASVRYNLTPWQTVGVNYSSPLVADLIPGDGPEVAVISKNDGKIHVWNATGNEVWVSTDQIDTGGDNTLSAGNIDNDSSNTLEISAPARPYKGVYAFGYDTSALAFEPLAGWPTMTEFQFDYVSAAIVDANADGAQEVTAGDESCYVYCWNGTGMWETNPSSRNSFLWLNLTGSESASIMYSSVAIGDIYSVGTPDSIPEALVGTGTYPRLYSFPGDEWGDRVNSPVYTPGWNPQDSESHGYTDNVSVQTSPAIGDIDGDGKNDVVVAAGNTVYLYLSISDSWNAAYTLGAITYSSPALADLDGDGKPEVVIGCSNGRVYALKRSGTALVDLSGWGGQTSGILLHEGYAVEASPIVGDVMNAGDNQPQVVAACTDGSVYALWKDGSNHAGGAIAQVWPCTQSEEESILATPALCSLDGSHVHLIVGSTDGIYKIELYSSTFQAGTSRFPWPTFHFNAARTGCITASASPVHGSVVGKVTRDGQPVLGASVYVYFQSDSGSSTVPVPKHPGQYRTSPVRTVGDSGRSAEINRGGYSINELQPSSSFTPTKLFKIKVVEPDSTTTWVQNITVPYGKTTVNVAL